MYRQRPRGSFSLSLDEKETISRRMSLVQWSLWNAFGGTRYCVVLVDKIMQTGCRSCAVVKQPVALDRIFASLSCIFSCARLNVHLYAYISLQAHKHKHTNTSTQTQAHKHKLLRGGRDSAKKTTACHFLQLILTNKF